MSSMEFIMEVFAKEFANTVCYDDALSMVRFWYNHNLIDRKEKDVLIYLLAEKFAKDLNEVEDYD